MHARADAGDADAAEALEVFCYRIRCTVGAYAAALGRLDAVVFTAGIGENDADVRARVCAGLGVLGVEVDEARNTAGSRATRTISADGSAVAVLVVPTNEELEIAEQTLAVVQAAARPDRPRGCSESGVGCIERTESRFRYIWARALAGARGQPAQKPRMCRSTASAASAGSPATTAS